MNKDKAIRQRAVFGAGRSFSRPAGRFVLPLLAAWVLILLSFSAVFAAQPENSPQPEYVPQGAGLQPSLNQRFLAPVGPAAYQVQTVMAEPLGESLYKRELHASVEHNLSYLPFMQVVDPRAVPGGTLLGSALGEEIDFERFRISRTDNLLTARWVDEHKVEMRVYEVLEGKFIFGAGFEVPDAAAVSGVADEFCAQYMEALIGRGDFFRSMLACSKSGGPRKSDIWVVKPTGGDLRQITNIPGHAISPTWSHDGRFIVFGHIDERSHALGVWDAFTNNLQRLRFPGNTVIGPCFMPDNKVAVSLSDGRNPSIFLLDRDFKKEKTLVSSWAIDVSPSVDASGERMVYTSSRLGNPHIFMTNLKTGETVKVSNEGKYNTDPCISPDGTLVVFARQMGEGHRIFAHDLRTGQEQQISFGPGSDEQPEFAPDSYFIAFTSTRAGSKKIYLTTRHGGEAKPVNTGAGEAAFPAWGARRR
ncbi:MAG: translocation protein TolB [Deltaproteobacteria bacterium]|nr:translocation protein TolB [Deltaproteobacteria bacterium]